MTVYFQIRSVQLDRSIKGLKDHFRKNSSSTGVPYSPAIQNKRKDTPTKKPIKRPGESLNGGSLYIISSCLCVWHTCTGPLAAEVDSVCFPGRKRNGISEISTSSLLWIQYWDYRPYLHYSSHWVCSLGWVLYTGKEQAITLTEEVSKETCERGKLMWFDNICPQPRNISCVTAKWKTQTW